MNKPRGYNSLPHGSVPVVWIPPLASTLSHLDPGGDMVLPSKPVSLGNVFGTSIMSAAVTDMEGTQSNRKH